MELVWGSKTRTEKSFPNRGLRTRSMSLALIRALTVALEMPVDELGEGAGDAVAFAATIVGCY